MLIGRDLPDLDLVSHRERRNGREIVHGLAFLFFPALGVDDVIAVEQEHRPRCPEQVLAQIEFHDGHVVDGGRHLRGHEPLPDQLVQAVLVRLEIVAESAPADG